MNQMGRHDENRWFTSHASKDFLRKRVSILQVGSWKENICEESPPSSLSSLIFFLKRSEDQLERDYIPLDMEDVKTIPCLLNLKIGRRHLLHTHRHTYPFWFPSLFLTNEQNLHRNWILESPETVVLSHERVFLYVLCPLLSILSWNKHGHEWLSCQSLEKDIE